MTAIKKAQRSTEMRASTSSRGYTIHYFGEVRKKISRVLPEAVTKPQRHEEVSSMDTKVSQIFLVLLHMNFGIN